MNQQEIIQKIKPILERHAITKAELFGSYARGDETVNSDVDMIVQLGRPTGLFEFVHIEQELTDAIGRKVDLTTAGGLSKYIQDRVLAEKKFIYERA